MINFKLKKLTANKLVILLFVSMGLAISTSTYVKGMSFDPFWFWSPDSSNENTNLAIPLPPLKLRYSLLRYTMSPMRQILSTDSSSDIYRLLQILKDATKGSLLLEILSFLKPISSYPFNLYLRLQLWYLQPNLLSIINKKKDLTNQQLTNQLEKLTNQQRLCFQTIPIRRELLKHIDKDTLRNLAQACKAIRKALEPITHVSLFISLDDLTESKLKRPAGLGTYQHTRALIIDMPDNSTLTKLHILLISYYFPHLKSLTFKKEVMHPHAHVKLNELAESALASKLEHLEFDEVKINKFTRYALNKFAQLKNLQIKDCYIHDRGLDELASSNVAQNLETLTLSSAIITKAGFTKENLDKFSELTSLDISYNTQLTDREAAILAESIIANKLEALDLQGTQITEANFEENNLAKFPQLKTLSFSILQQRPR